MDNKNNFVSNNIIIYIVLIDYAGGIYTLCNLIDVACSVGE
ncbi:hypothetical protein STRDD04_00483 [Streptococcus sp. DD04]|nr:hypothetical protein STRDD04_00483 [Streptococcus sp. DD04]